MSTEATPSLPTVHLSSLTFSDSTTLELGENDVMILVGPNNAGKSATLRAIQSKLSGPDNDSPVLQSLELRKHGSPEEVLASVESWAKLVLNPPNDPAYSVFGTRVSRAGIGLFWGQRNCLSSMTRWFCHLLSAEERLQLTQPPESISFNNQALRHPIHFLQRDDRLELELSALFRKAFGVDLIVHRSNGSTVPLYAGDRPSVVPGEDRASFSYAQKVEALIALDQQGDGMRSFAGVLLATSVGRENILLIDEPEAFLHPPQAKLLGTILVRNRRLPRQMLIATHSTDVLRGVLEADSSDVKVVRISRKGSQNHVRQLDNARIRELWSDPLLRYSNILDGLFHEGVVVCEADSDCRFYSAMLEAALAVQNPDAKVPDLMFTHCGGKHRLPLVIRSLREIDVPVSAIADFDILSEVSPLKETAEALGCSWSELEADWKIVKSAVNSKRPELSTEEVKAEVERVLGKVSAPVFPEMEREELQKILKRSSAWSNAKLAGTAFLPSGDPSKACERLLAKLRNAGLHVVEVGELESFVRTEGNHGPKWVNAVLGRDLRRDNELESARQFVLRLVPE